LCRYDAAWRVPAVVEVLPYGAHHATVDADEATWPYLAGHGIACVRVDSRGAGNSSGVLDDEYSAQQQRDACDAVEWAARQGWCTGSVGLMGCSWGGFIALQAAALAGVNEAAATASPDCLPIQGVQVSAAAASVARRRRRQPCSAPGNSQPKVAHNAAAAAAAAH
jgi:putative CocE/NonD family hydrolase